MKNGLKMSFECTEKIVPAWNFWLTGGTASTSCTYVQYYYELVGLPGFTWDFHCHLCLYVSLFLCLSISLYLCAPLPPAPSLSKEEIPCCWASFFVGPTLLYYRCICSQTCVNNHLWTTINEEQTVNNDHLWTTATFFECQGWPLYTGLTVVCKWYNKENKTAN